MKSITANWKECVVSYEKLTEEGLQKRVKETYVVDGIYFGEAEEKIIKFMQGIGVTDLEVLNITPASYKEVIFDEDEDSVFWYKAKIQLIIYDEKSGKEKKQNVNYLVQASAFDCAKQNINEVLKGTMLDYTIAKIEEVNIIDVITK